MSLNDSYPAVGPAVKKIGAVFAGISLLYPVSAAAGSSNVAPAPVRGGAVHRKAPANSAPGRDAVGMLGALGVRFEKNEGQSGSPAKFLWRGPGHSLFLAPNEVVMSVPASKGRKLAKGNASLKGGVKRPVKPATAASDVLRMRLLGGKTGPAVVGIKQLPGTSNYFQGSDPKGWRTEIPSYSKVAYRGVYSGIDMVFRGNKGKVEYDFIVAPGADPKRIAMNFASAKSLSLDRRGDLVIKTSSGRLIQRRPHVYQTFKGKREAVAGDFELRGKQVGFRLGAYDTKRPLVIDPTLIFSTYLGGGKDDSARGVATDPSGNSYITGLTQGSGFPTQNAYQTSPSIAPTGSSAYNAFVAKFDPAGELIYSTYLDGEGTEQGLGIAADSAGNAYITGETHDSTPSTLSPNPSPFPTTPGSYYNVKGGPETDVFVTKLSASGSSLVYSARFGGLGSSGRAIRLDGAGNAYIAGTTAGEFPVKNAFQSQHQGGTKLDAFVAKLNSAGSDLIYSTYLGGADEEGGGAGGPSINLAVDASGTSYVTGATKSRDDPATNAVNEGFPTLNATQPGLRGLSDAFLTKLDPNGAVGYSTYLGGDGEEDYNIAQKSSAAVAVDSGNVYVAGSTTSTDFPSPATDRYQPRYNGGFTDAYVAHLNPEGVLVRSTYLGGDGLDYASGISVDATGALWLTGGTQSSNFPLQNAYQPVNRGNYDVFVSRLAASLDSQPSTLMYSTYLGGKRADQAFGAALDPSGNAYVAGLTQSSDDLLTLENDGFPTKDAVQPAGGGNADVFLAKIGALVPKIQSVDPNFGPVVGGTQVTITGENLAGATGVKFGADSASSFTPDPSTPDTKMTAVSPPQAAQAVHIRVATAEATSPEAAADVFTYMAAAGPVPPPPGKGPFVSSLSPPSGPKAGGTPVTIMGARLAGATQVDFGGLVVPSSGFSAASDAEIKLNSPARGTPGTVDVKVTTPGGVSNAAPFTYEEPPPPPPPVPPAQSGSQGFGAQNASVQKPLSPPPPGGSGVSSSPGFVKLPVPVSAAGPVSSASSVSSSAPLGVSSAVPSQAGAQALMPGLSAAPEDGADPAPAFHNMVGQSGSRYVYDGSLWFVFGLFGLGMFGRRYASAWGAREAQTSCGLAVAFAGR